MLPIRQIRRCLPPAELQFGQRVALGQPALKSGDLKTIVVRDGTKREDFLWISEAWLVNQIPGEQLHASITPGQQRDKVLLRLYRIRVQPGILSLKERRKEGKEGKDHL